MKAVISFVGNTALIAAALVILGIVAAGEWLTGGSRGRPSSYP